MADAAVDSLRQRLAVLQLPNREALVYFHRRGTAAQGAPGPSPHLFPVVRNPLFQFRLGLAAAVLPLVAAWFSSSQAAPRTNIPCASSERKIDQIEGRLGNIEVLLQKLVSSQPIAPVHPLRSQAHTPSTTAAASSASHPTASSAADCDTSDDESGYGGDEGLTAHTAFASDFLERAVKRTSLREVNPKVEAALANLSQLVEMQKHRSISSGPRFPLQVPIPPGGLSKMPMPPLDVVVGLLKQNKGKRAWLFLGVPRPLTLSDTPLTIFTITCSLTGITDFTAMCRLVYFPSDDFSDAYFTIVNAGLYNLFMEQQVLAQDPVLKDQYDAHMKLCRSNLETSLANLPLFLSPKTENVMALHMGVRNIQSTCKRSVSSR